jgi:hypothetical protein
VACMTPEDRSRGETILAKFGAVIEESRPSYQIGCRFRPPVSCGPYPPGRSQQLTPADILHRGRLGVASKPEGVWLVPGAVRVAALAGMDRTRLSMLENGHAQPSEEEISRLSAALDQLIEANAPSSGQPGFIAKFVEANGEAMDRGEVTLAMLGGDVE